MSALSVDVIDNYYYNRDPAISGFWKKEYITYYKERNARKLNHLPLSVRVPIEEDNPSILRHEAACIRCGMCANVCPVDSIVERDECPQVRQAAADPDRVLVVSTSPSVRAALGEEFGMEPGAFVEGKMVALLRALGSRLCAGHQLRRRPDHCGGGQ